MQYDRGMHANASALLKWCKDVRLFIPELSRPNELFFPMRHEKSCGAVVFRENKFLLLKTSKSKNWGAPKGHVENQETEEETARREIFEETGLSNLRFLPGFRQINHFSLYMNGKKISKEVVFFLAESKSGDVKLSEEHNAYEWLSFGEAIHRVKFRALKSILLNAAKTLNPKFTLLPLPTEKA